MIDLENVNLRDAERAAYSSGDTLKAKLLARIMDLEEELEREMPLRGEGKVIYPYPSFGQVGPTGQTTSQQSQGRPPGADMDPEHAAQNSENARGR